MDGALLVSVADAPVLASGVATKLRNAAIANGDLVIPTSKGPLAGRQFRQLGQLAALTEVEAMALVGWIERRRAHAPRGRLSRAAASAASLRWKLVVLAQG